MGKYTCVLERGEETISADVWITLRREIVFLDQPSDATVEFGESHIFPCSAEGAVDISWTKNGQPSDTFIDGDRILQHRGDLVFTAVTLTDSGRYSCKARGRGDRRIEAQAILKVDIDVHNVCGRPFHPHGPDGFVVGGMEVDPGAFPWQAMLWDIRPARNRFFCSGSLLNGRWVITAAHCILETEVRRDDFIVRLGRHTTRRGVFERTERVDEIIVHPYFNGYTYDSDIALLKLSGPEVTFTEYILPICLPDVLDARRLLRSGQIGTVTGWGATEEGGSPSTTLMKVSLPVVSLGRCRHAHPQYADGMSKNMFCAGRISGGRDACRGDSGGPFAAYDNGRSKLLGIVSWGDGCARQGKYGVYTRVHRFREWIATYVDKPADPVDSGSNNIIPCNSAPCQNNAWCILAEDREGGYYCNCPSGFQGKHCETVTTTAIQTDLCDSNPCQNGGECFRNDAGYRCFCSEDWYGDNCEKRKPCSVNPCLNDGTCYEYGDDFTCSCPEEWKGKTCEIDVNECNLAKGGCEHTCTNFDGGFECSCLNGYQLDGDGYHCTDKDECGAGPRYGPCQQICRNTEGSYKCSCWEGYEMDEEGFECIGYDDDITHIDWFSEDRYRDRFSEERDEDYY
ncbi:F2 [Branchiostoma lanceolatum]|uniref:F2 protein n=1 Tax=Branchiostoma lanceolatum TaxID=7740 RepID=A0A8K0F3Z6_BRALA|nr:F2 [Branchiostoma lanceolatum]